MVTVIKSEWHEVERRYGVDIDDIILSEIYPNMTEEEITKLLVDLQSGEASIEQVMEDAGWDVNIDWEWLDEDDWWTDRKGGYEVTYEVQTGEE
jgi:hypothetical protein